MRKSYEQERVKLVKAKKHEHPKIQNKEDKPELLRAVASNIIF